MRRGTSRRVKHEKQTSASKKKFEANKSLGPIVDSTSRLKFYTISDKSLYVKLTIQIKSEFCRSEQDFLSFFSGSIYDSNF